MVANSSKRGAIWGPNSAAFWKCRNNKGKVRPALIWSQKYGFVPHWMRVEGLINTVGCCMESWQIFWCNPTAQKQQHNPCCGPPSCTENRNITAVKRKILKGSTRQNETGFFWQERNKHTAVVYVIGVLVFIAAYRVLEAETKILHHKYTVQL